MSDRKLATIQRISKLEPIEGADNIEKATILGWELVVKKGEFKINDQCVYIEVDSQLPERPEFEFLRSRKFRVKTIKLKGQVSQGIAFPLSILPINNHWYDGDGVSELLGIKKYDPQAELEKSQTSSQRQPKNAFEKFLMRYSWYRKLFLKSKTGNWPSFISKTDEDRIQLFPHICENEKDTIFQVSEKLDGQSATYFLIRNKKWWQYWEPYIFGVCSRNIWKKAEDNSTYWQIAKKYDIKNKLKYIHTIVNTKNIYIQGEILGKGIQGNKYKLEDIDFYVFNIFNLDNNKKLSTGLIETVCEYSGLKHVPYLEYFFSLKSSIPEIVEYAKGKSLLNPEIPREGIVVRNYEKNISFKIINYEFLLKYSE